MLILQSNLIYLYAQEVESTNSVPWKKHGWACNSSTGEPTLIYSHQKYGKWRLGYSIDVPSPIVWGDYEWNQESDVPKLGDDFDIDEQSWVIVYPYEFGVVPNQTCEQACEKINSCICSNGAISSFTFLNSTHTIKMNSKYGLTDVYVLCLSDDLLVDGSTSRCENSYFVGLAEFDLMSWANINLLHDDWISPLSPAPNNIDITSFLPQGYQLRPNIVYNFKLAVGQPWHSEELRFTIDCCKRKPDMPSQEIPRKN